MPTISDLQSNKTCFQPCLEQKGAVFARSQTFQEKGKSWLLPLLSNSFASKLACPWRVSKVSPESRSSAQSVPIDPFLSGAKAFRLSRGHAIPVSFRLLWSHKARPQLSPSDHKPDRRTTLYYGYGPFVYIFCRKWLFRWTTWPKPYTLIWAFYFLECSKNIPAFPFARST